jgi:serine phosphatase RsbU (regulator of sigma subunit)
VEIAIPGSLPLGILAHAQHEAMSLLLTPGDRLTFVSDGVPESQAKSGELFGFDRTRSVSCEPAAKIADTARSFGQLDDITVVTVEFSGVSAAVASAK